MSILFTLDSNIWSPDLLATWKMTMNSSQIFPVLYRKKFLDEHFFSPPSTFLFWSFIWRETFSKSFIWINLSNIASYISHRNVFSETLHWSLRNCCPAFSQKNTTGFYIMFKSNSEMWLWFREHRFFKWFCFQDRLGRQEKWVLERSLHELIA